jgi:hypothetical protein
VLSFQLAERVSHLLQRVGAGDLHLLFPARSEPGQLAHDDRARRRAFCSLARPITVAPRRRASCTASDPTPPAAPEMTTVSAGPGSTANTVAYAVVPATYNDPATSQDSPAGRVVNATSSATTNSAWLLNDSDVELSSQERCRRSGLTSPDPVTARPLIQPPEHFCQ